jgi:SRSO17 transposase
MPKHGSSMRSAGLDELHPGLQSYVQEVFATLPRRDQRIQGECYLRGLMLEGHRKSIQSMAAQLPDANEQALHHFVSGSPWDWRPVRRRVAERVCAALDPAVWAIGDRDFPKVGRASVGVHRHSARSLSGIVNCQVGVCTHALSDTIGCPINWRLFIPPAWERDAQRRAAAHVPDSVRYRPKWLLALDMLDELSSWQLHPRVVLVDTPYGEPGPFLEALDRRQLRYVAQLPAAASAILERPRPAATVRRTWGQPASPGHDAAATSLQQLASAVWPHGLAGDAHDPNGRDILSSRFSALRGQIADASLRHDASHEGTRSELPTRWLLFEWLRDEARPVRYWISNLPEDGRPSSLVRIVTLRSHLEQQDRELRVRLGLDHFEGRSYQGWHHHVTLVSAAQAFLILARARRTP